MEWIPVKLGSGMAGDRLVRADSIIEVRIKSSSSATLLDAQGHSFEWLTTGTMAEYARLVRALNLAEVA